MGVFQRRLSGKNCEATLVSSLEIRSGQAEGEKAASANPILWLPLTARSLQFSQSQLSRPGGLPACLFISLRFLSTMASHHTYNQPFCGYALWGYICLDLSNVQLGFSFSTPFLFPIERERRIPPFWKNEKIARALLHHPSYRFRQVNIQT